MLETDPKLRAIANKRIIYSTTRAENMKDRLVHSRLEYSPPEKPERKPIKEHKICDNSKCQYCPMLDKSGKIVSTTTGKPNIVPQLYTCKSNNLVYLITCTLCGAQYVGQTQHTIARRFQDHRLQIRHALNWSKAPESYKEKGKTNVSHHFSQGHHNLSHVKVNVLEFIKAKPDSDLALQLRLASETHWMYKLRTLSPFGINATDGATHARYRPDRCNLNKKNKEKEEI